MITEGVQLYNCSVGEASEDAVGGSPEGSGFLRSRDYTWRRSAGSVTVDSDANAFGGQATRAFACGRIRRASAAGGGKRCRGRA